MRKIQGIPLYVQDIVDQQKRDAEGSGFLETDVKEMLEKLGLRKKPSFFAKISEWIKTTLPSEKKEKTNPKI